MPKINEIAHVYLRLLMFGALMFFFLSIYGNWIIMHSLAIGDKQFFRLAWTMSIRMREVNHTDMIQKLRDVNVGTNQLSCLTTNY